MKDVEVYRFLKRVQQKLKAKKVEDAVKFVVIDPYVEFCSKFGENPDKSLARENWMQVRHAFSAFFWEKKRKKWLVDEEIGDEIFADFFRLLKVSMVEKIKAWFWLKFSRGW